MPEGSGDRVSSPGDRNQTGNARREEVLAGERAEYLTARKRISFRWVVDSPSGHALMKQNLARVLGGAFTAEPATARL